MAKNLTVIGILLTILGGLITYESRSQNAVLAAGKWYKISVAEDAIYKIDYNFLKRAGINADAVDPKKIQLFTGLNSMLPQPNATTRPADLQEIPLLVVGGDDGKFNQSDYILFFGQGPDEYHLIPGKNVFQYQNNLFTDKNYYFLTAGSVDGKRMTSIAQQAGSFPVVSEYDDFGYYETEQHSELHSGRKWYGELFDSKTEYTIRFEFSGIVDGTSIRLITGLMGKSTGPSSFQILLNDVAITTHNVPPIVDSQYAVKGSDVVDTLTVSANSVAAPSRTNQDVKLRFTKATSGISVGYIDYVLLHVKRRLALNGNQVIFSSLKSLDQPVTQYFITGAPSGSLIFDVTDPWNTASQEYTFSGSSSSFTALSGSLKKYALVSNHNYPTPGEEGNVPNQNIHGIGSVSLVIVTAPEFLGEAQRLADFRQATGIATQVVTTQEVYNEFSGGKQDVTAIRDMIRHLFNKGSGIKNLLLFGRGSYDYKNYLPNNKNFVPTYQSRNSISPLETYSSDDYFAFLESNEGNWGEDPPQDHTMDIGVGRLPFKKVEEAQAMVDKMIEYGSQNWGEWRKSILFVADDGDFNIHHNQADQLALSIETTHPEFNTQKIFLDDYRQVDTSIGQTSPDATQALSQAVRDGVAIVNYTGHGNELQLTQERILDQLSIDKWKTSPNYPLLVTATCEFGRNDDPSIISTAELSLFKKEGGSIGMVTTTRPVNSSTNFILNSAFYQALFIKNMNQFRDMGTIFRDTKNNSLSGVANRNFSLLADPSMKPPLPVSDLRLTSAINLSSGSDTLKALSKVRLSGQLYTGGSPNTTYNGTVTATLFDKATTHITKGDENAAFTFKNFDNAIFRGKASLRNGQFTVEFVVPNSINPNVSLSKLSLYGSPQAGVEDVAGSNSTLKVGALEKNPGVDAKGPDIELFMGDTSFVSGGIAGRNSRIVAILTDNNGINTSSYDPQKNIIANLDDTLALTLNNYYQADVDTYQRGKVNFAIDNLKPGSHLLTLKAADTFGNVSTKTISFFVSDQNDIVVEQWINYPNPVTDNCTFHFKHNRSGDDLEALVTLYNTMGQTMMESTYQITGSAYQVDLPAWDATGSSGIKLNGGLYLLKLAVRSLQDGSKNEKITKVIIVN